MSDASHQEKVIRLLAQTQERLLRYVLVLLPDWDSAQEVVQNTHVVVWRKSEEFRSNTEEDFYRWIKQIAFYEVKKQLTKQAARPTLLDPALVVLISDEFNEMDEDLDARREALAFCVEKLAPKDQELLRLRYWGEGSVAALSVQLGRSVDSIYKSLQRIRQALLKCIEREARRAGR
jgi:RNA polymerase sigma-70 factor (ECF subfamily)